MNYAIQEVLLSFEINFESNYLCIWILMQEVISIAWDYLLPFCLSSHNRLGKTLIWMVKIQLWWVLA